MIKKNSYDWMNLVNLTLMESDLYWHLQHHLCFALLVFASPVLFEAGIRYLNEQQMVRIRRAAYCIEFLWRTNMGQNNVSRNVNSGSHVDMCNQLKKHDKYLVGEMQENIVRNKSIYMHIKVCSLCLHLSFMFAYLFHFQDRPAQRQLEVVAKVM